MQDRLSSKEKRFCELYVEGYNANEAYAEAYGCKKENAHASRVMKRDRVKKYIAELQQEAFENACISAERVALKLADIAFAKKGDEYYLATSQLKALDLLQKQLGLQHQKIEADITQDIVINVEE